MNFKAWPAIAILFLCSIFCRAQTISVDMDTTPGLQNVKITKDTAETVAVAFRISGVNAMFSFQFKAGFDTTRFSFLAAFQDFGPAGEKNILTLNGGSIIGIGQLQVNPAASDTVEFSYSITGTDEAKSVNGEGLIGVLYLKSKLSPGDTSSITVGNGYVASFGGDLLPLTSYNAGKFIILPRVGIENRKGEGKNIHSYDKLILRIKNSQVQFAIPEILFRADNDFLVRIFALDGRLMTSFRLPVNKNIKNYDINQKTDNTFNNAGTYLFSVEAGGSRFTKTIILP